MFAGEDNMTQHQLGGSCYSKKGRVFQKQEGKRTEAKVVHGVGESKSVPNNKRNKKKERVFQEIRRNEN